MRFDAVSVELLPDGEARVGQGCILYHRTLERNWLLTLADNLRTLTQRGGDTAEQRYGVLLSLSRGNILDPDVSMSYALELGRDNPEYMRSVLTNIEHKEIGRAHV